MVEWFWRGAWSGGFDETAGRARDARHETRKRTPPVSRLTSSFVSCLLSLALPLSRPARSRAPSADVRRFHRNRPTKPRKRTGRRGVACSREANRAVGAVARASPLGVSSRPSGRPGTQGADLCETPMRGNVPSEDENTLRNNSSGPAREGRRKTPSGEAPATAPPNGRGFASSIRPPPTTGTEIYH